MKLFLNFLNFARAKEYIWCTLKEGAITLALDSDLCLEADIVDEKEVRSMLSISD
jgi:hypothetical protein